MLELSECKKMTVLEKIHIVGWKNGIKFYAFWIIWNVCWKMYKIGEKNQERYAYKMLDVSKNKYFTGKHFT